MNLSEISPFYLKLVTFIANQWYQKIAVGKILCLESVYLTLFIVIQKNLILSVVNGSNKTGKLENLFTLGLQRIGYRDDIPEMFTKIEIFNGSIYIYRTKFWLFDICS